MQTGLGAALQLAKSGDINGARSALSLDQKFTNAEMMEGLINLSKALELFDSQEPMAAFEPFQKAFPIIDASLDEGAKYIIHTLADFAGGLSKLFNGDAHEAAKLLNRTTENMEQISFFDPNFRIAALSYKAASFIALGRTHMHASNISGAEEAFGRARQTHDELLKVLSPSNEQHAIAYAEVYAIRVEVELWFTMTMDLAAFDLNSIKKRLDATREDVRELEKVIRKVPEGSIQKLLKAYPILFSVLEDFCNSLEIATLKRRPFNKEEVEALVQADGKLYHARQLVQASGERGRGLLFHINQLARLQQNLLYLGKAATQDFGRYGGIVSLISLIVLIVVLHLTIKPSGYEAILFFFGSLVLSLIVGYGFGALRFKPFLKIFSAAIAKKSDESE